MTEAETIKDAVDAPTRRQGDRDPPGGPMLSPERLAELAPKLRTLLADLEMLEELTGPEVEPAPSWPGQGFADGGG